MPWQPALGTQPLAAFDHQVAGQSSMLRYDTTTVCKPLIAREHFVYKTLPPELKEFTPEYRGEIEVKLIEEDGYIQLYGLSVGDEADEAAVYPCTSILGSHDHKSLLDTPEETFIQNRSMARVLRSGSYEVYPSSDQVFYAADSNPDNPHTHSLNPWSLKNHKRLLDKLRKSEKNDNKIRFLLLKNVVADFRHPCILDLKIGSRLYGDDASSAKVASQSRKCHETTSSSLGVRLCGMQVYQVESGAYHSVDKYHGRTLNDESFRDMLYNFLHNGTRFRLELIQPIVSRLSELIKCLEDLHSFRFYASSLLIIYDGDVGLTAANEETKVQAFESVVSAVTADSGSDEHVTEHYHDSKTFGQKTKLQAFKSHIFTDSKSDKHITEHLDSNKLCQERNQWMFGSHITTDSGSVKNTTEHQDSNKLCQKTSQRTFESHITADLVSIKHATEHLPDSKNVCQCVTRQIDKICCDTYLSSLPKLSLNQIAQQPVFVAEILESDSESLMVEGQSTVFTSESSSEKSHSKIATSNTNHHLDTVNQKGGEVFDTTTQPSSISCVNRRSAHSFTDNLEQSQISKKSLENLSDVDHKARSHLSNSLSHSQQIHNISVVESEHHEDLSRKEERQLTERVRVAFPSGTTDSQNTSPRAQSLTVSVQNPQSVCRDSVKVDVKMIDFAHTTHRGFTSDKIQHDGPDSDYIFGLKNLMKLFQELNVKK